MITQLFVLVTQQLVPGMHNAITSTDEATLQKWHHKFSLPGGPLPNNRPENAQHATCPPEQQPVLPRAACGRCQTNQLLATQLP